MERQSERGLVSIHLLSRALDAGVNNVCRQKLRQEEVETIRVLFIF